MADGEEVTLDGRPLQALRVADLKAALEQRGLAKSGQKSALIKRLRGALMLENLQKHSTPHTTFQPNSQSWGENPGVLPFSPPQIGEEMSQNSFIKQYLEKQQELLRQRLEREAREAADTEGKSCFMSRDQEDSDEERARRQERRSTRVRQARTTKTLESLQSVGKEELEAQHRGRRSTPRVAIKPEDDDEEEEEEEDDDEEEEEEEEEDEEEESPSVLARRVLERKGLSGIPVPQKEQAAPEPQPAEERAADTRGPETALPLASQPQAGPQPGEAGQTTSSQPGDKQEPAPRLKEEERETGALGAPEVKDADQEPEAPWEVEEPGPPKEEAAPGILKEERAELQEEGVFGPPEPQEERGAGHKLLKDKAADQAPQLQEVGVTEVPEPREKGEAQADEDPEQAVEAPGTLEKATAAAALTQGSPSPPELMEAQCPQQAPSGDEPPPPLLTKEAPPSPAPRVDEAPPQLSRTSPPTQEPPPAATAKPIVRETEPRRLPSPLPRRRPRGRSSSSRSSSSSNSSSSRSRDSSGSRSRKRRSRSGSSESPARKRRASGSHSGSDRPKRSRSRSRSGSRSSSDSSRKSHSPESSRDSSNFPRTKEPSAPGELAPHSSPQAQQEAPPTPKTEKRMAPSLPPAPQRRPSHTHQHGASTEPQRPALQRGNSDPPVPSEAAASAVEGPGGEPQPPAERRHSNAEEKQEVPMEPSEPRPESEGPSPEEPPPGPDMAPEDEDKKEGSSQPKAFKRKISVVSAAKGNSDVEGSQQGGRKRRWGSSTAATQKKPSISITTESLKSLIPDIKPPAGGQEVVVDLHADDSRISEDEAERHPEEPPHEKALKICRTVTQVVPAEGQENGQGEEEEEEKGREEEAPEPLQVAVETVLPPPAEHEVKKVTLSDTLTRRSISQQRSGVSITIDDPVRTAQAPSPPRGKVSSIVHICNLVRPFTLGQLKELLGRTGTLVEEAFWIDKIKSHCYVTYSTVEEAVTTRNALHGVKWPQSNPKFLSADFAEQDELDFHRGLLAERPVEARGPALVEEAGPGPVGAGPLRGERESARRPEASVREQWAEREREMERRERTRAEREWDRDKVREGPRSRSRSRERRRKERPKSKEKKSEKKEKAQEEPPAKLLDDLFRKTKAAPCIYWLPLTDTQFVQKQAERAARARERERRRKEQEAEEARQRERSRQAEREKRREHSRERPNATGGAGAGGERGGGGRERERREAKSRHSRSRSRSTPVRDRGGRR